MTDGHPESSHDFRKDTVVVLKHSRFIVLLFLGALAVALLTGLVTDTDYVATTEVEIEVTDVPALSSRNEFTAKLETFEELATSDEVATEVAARLPNTQTPSELLSLISIRTVASTSVDPRDRIIIEAEGSSTSDASTLASTWAEVVAEQAVATTVDPEALRSLQAAEAAAQDRLDAVDPTAARELGSISTELRSARQRVVSLQTRIVELDDALAFMEAHPEVSLDELRVAFASLLVDLDSPPYETVEELASGLRLRREFLRVLIPSVEAEIEKLVQQEEELTVESGERTAAQNALLGTQQTLATADLLATTAKVTADVTEGAPKVSGGVDWLARIGAAGAFGLVAGVAGAFALEYLAPSLHPWWRRSERTSQEED